MPTDANCLMIAPREKLIQALADWKDDMHLESQHQIRKIMHHLQEPCVAFNTYEPVLCYYHGEGNDSLERTRRKRPWPIISYDIPKWRKAKDMIRLWT
jgi:hypothetical protein